ncbi:MAG: PPOX class F420-dependent oxidoreductase [Phototrophicaceae bacterium]|jgi:PPOX class probable F420-dependent enzyme
MIPDNYKDLFEKPVLVTFVTMLPDGQPQATPVWCSYDGEYILINSALGRRKDKNIRANPKVTILAVDPADPYRYLEVRGEVTEIIEDQAQAVAHIDALALKYTGKTPYYGGFSRDAVQTRVIYKVKPTRINAH